MFDLLIILFVLFDISYKVYKMFNKENFIFFTKLHNNAKYPIYNSSSYNLHLLNEESLTIKSKEVKIFRTGIQIHWVNSKKNIAAVIISRHIYKNIDIAQDIIDNNYNGEILIRLYNRGNSDQNLSSVRSIAKLFLINIL